MKLALLVLGLFVNLPFAWASPNVEIVFFEDSIRERELDLSWLTMYGSECGSKTFKMIGNDFPKKYRDLVLSGNDEVIGVYIIRNGCDSKEKLRGHFPLRWSEVSRKNYVSTLKLRRFELRLKMQNYELLPLDSLPVVNQDSD